MLVFGTGAIGGAVARRLQRVRPFTATNVRVPWSDAAARVAALDGVFSALEQRAQQRPVRVIWAAGKAGFAATSAETEGEFVAYAEVVERVKRLQRRDGGSRHRFHMFSSAGGLYEGRSVRAPSEEPAPVREYGHLKLAQEQHGLAELAADGIAIYRPSSVYALPGHGARLGLVGILVRNGIAQRTSTIVGALDTLRDYVLAPDIGVYVADRAIGDVDDEPNVHMLVSGSPASILQVIAAVESVIRRRLYVRIAEAWNAQNITFSPTVRASRFSPTPLRVGVEMVHAASLGRPTVG